MSGMDQPKPKPVRTASDISAIMRRVHDRDTAPELAFRRALHARGLRYRIYVGELPGKPDVVFPRGRVAVFIDGDFWHGGQWQTRGLRRLEQQFTRTDTRDYWLRKIRRTMQRDAANTAKLLAAGWTVLRFWESDVRHALDACVETTLAALNPADGARQHIPIAEKTIALRSSVTDHLRSGLESHGWWVIFPTSADEERGDPPGDASTADVPPVTLAASSLGESSDVQFGGHERLLWAARETQESRPPLLLLECDMAWLDDDNASEFARALRELSGCEYEVDAFVCHERRSNHSQPRRLFVVGVHNSVTRTSVRRERLSALSLTSEEHGVRPVALAEFIQAHSEIAWNLRALPQPSGDAATTSAGTSVAGGDEAIEWIAMYYLNPLVNELLRGKPLYPVIGSGDTITRRARE